MSTSAYSSADLIRLFDALNTKCHDLGVYRRKFDGSIDSLELVSGLLPSGELRDFVDALAADCDDFNFNPNLSIISDQDAFGVAVESDGLLLDFDFNREVPQQFLLAGGDGWMVLVDTQGYKYARYVVRIA